MSEHGTAQYEAEIRWTTHGVAHIRASDWGSLGFGQGYACARDHLPTIADQIVKVRSERAAFHGAGPDGAHLALDVGYRVLGVRERAPRLRDAQPPELRQLVTGYTSGYNAWVAEAAGTDALPAWCRDAPWIRPIDEIDLWTYYVDMALLASGRNLAEIIGRAEAPGPDGPAAAAPVSALGGGAGASNGWAFGGDATASGHGIVMANPHFPWGGEARFWESHLTLPGEIDAYGVSLLAAPGIQLGFNAHVGWTHTFSRGHRFTLASLDLVPGEPTRYRYGTDERAMEPVEVTVDVLGDDGELAPTTVTRWRSHHGPIVNLPLLGWGLETAFTYRDANLDNDGVLAQFLGMARSGSLEEFRSVFEDVQGLPWVNTLAADRTGRAWYIDASATPLLSDEAIARYRDRVATDLVAALLLENRVALLDGSEPGDEWQDDPDARSPGLLPHRSFPQLERRDYVVNANDSHWLTHATERLEGYSPMHGFEGTPRSLRTRQNLLVAAALAASGEVTTTATLDAVFADASLSAELLCDAVVARCRGAAPVVVEGTTVDLQPAVEVLAAWDQTYRLDAVGAALWRELMTSFDPKAHLDAGPLFAEPWSIDDPVATPRGLAPAPAVGDDPIALALGAAILALDAAEVPIDAPLRDVQWARRGDRTVPVPGGTECDGVLDVLSPIGALSSLSLDPASPPRAPIPGRTERSGLTVGGYECTYGASFLMAVELTDDGPVGQGLLAYGQSGDARSPHHLDGTVAYASAEPRPLLFHDADIEADEHLVRRVVSGSALSPG